jgi:hypothetical protein
MSEQDYKPQKALCIHSTHLTQRHRERCGMLHLENYKSQRALRVTQSLDARHNLSIPDVPDGGSSRYAPRPSTACRPATKAAGPCCLEPQKPRRTTRSTLMLKSAQNYPATPDPLPHRADLSRLLTSNLIPVFRACVKRLQCARR